MYSTALYFKEQRIGAIHDVVFHRLMRKVSKEAVHPGRLTGVSENCTWRTHFIVYSAVNPPIKCDLCESLLSQLHLVAFYLVWIYSKQRQALLLWWFQEGKPNLLPCSVWVRAFGVQWCGFFGRTLHSSCW